ncbi:MAG: hypothetical protein HKN92_06995, partial [Chitinophagales bacterium]|nr:hypothetical protein [Chitinophagales bacterium]
MMSRVKSLLMLALMVTCFLSEKAYATHAMGGDITYQCLGNNQYLLTLKFYRDCNGIPAPVGGSDLVFKITSPDCNANFTASFIPIPDSTEIITPICFAAVDRCTSTSGVFGIEKYVYQYTLDLSSYNGCGDDWSLEWDYCCRNNAITSLQSPGSQQIYLNTTIDNTIGTNNHSPEFRNEPTPFGCVLQEMTYNHGVRDLDGDSLVFSLAPARTVNGNTITYASGYSASQPIKTTTGVQIDPQTGSLTFTPSVQQVAVVSVLVEEYRNGVKINELIRDVQFSIVQCTNFLPTVSGFDSTDMFTIDACVGDTVCYTFYSDDADPGDSVYLSWNQGIVGAVFTTTNGSDLMAKATLCWVPTSSNIGPNLFSITARDNACDLNGVSSFGYKIQVFPSKDAELPQDFSVCSDTSVTISGNLPKGTVNSRWNVSGVMADTM